MLVSSSRFFAASEESRYDMDLLIRRFGVSYEQAAHRLTTLARAGERGVPFVLLKVDIAGTVSKRFAGEGMPLAQFGGGGTNCGLPLQRLNQRKATGDLVIYVSDNESWADPQRGRGTETMRQWEMFRQRNPRARLACIDIQPYATVQAQTREDVLNVGGFSDAVFEVLARFAAGQLDGEHWVREIEAVEV